ncbi:MAG: (Fe-S)-binding protein [Armatimonadetes bacterium]|nr:(Fe-S)-binding protein [Armatimonadota bacterium]
MDNIPPFSLLNKIILLSLILISLSIFSYILYDRLRLIFLGKKAKRFNKIPLRIKTLFLYVLGHKKVFAYAYSGILHFFIFWGFIILAVSYIDLLGKAFFLNFKLPILGNNLIYPYFLDLRDFFGILAIIGVILALMRRFIFKPERLENSKEALIILILIFLVVSMGFLSESLRYSLEKNPANSLSFIAKNLALLFNNFPKEKILLYYELSWWAHLIIILGFLIYIPLSKHLHLITCPIAEFFRNLDSPGALPYLDLEKEERFGAELFSDFSWKDLLDLYACTECGRCQENCPAYLTKKPLSPKKVILNLKKELLAQKEIFKPLIGKAVAEDEIWSCTTCGNCQEHCPVFIEPLNKIAEFKRHLVLTQSKFPKELTLCYRNLEVNLNPWGIGYMEREKFVHNLEINIKNKEASLLYFAGCAASFDERNKKVSRSLIKILKSLEVDFTLLGTDEACCGDPARRTGNEYLYQNLAQKNIQTFKNYKFKKILTSCPHCFNTLKNEYSQMGGNFEVIHHSVFLADLIKEKKLKLFKKIPQTITYHDSCYLGRFNNIYDHPRQIIQNLSSGKLVEMTHHHNKSFCCGAGGGKMWMEELQGEKIYIKRADEVVKTKSQIVASACPYCLTMMEDGLKEKNIDER